MGQRDEFDSAGAYVAFSDLIGELVLFTPVEYVEEVTTVHGTKDAVISDVVVLSGTDAGTVYESAMVLQGKMIGALKRKVPVYTNGVMTREGRKLLGVVKRGDAKKGQQAPYELAAPTDAQKQIARDYLAGRTIEAAAEDNQADDPFAVKQ